MNNRSNDSGVSQRRIPWFAIALALIVTVSGLGRSAVAQKPAPRAPQPAAEPVPPIAPARAKSDLIGEDWDEPKPFTFAFPEPKIGAFNFAETKISPFTFALPSPKALTAFNSLDFDMALEKYSVATNAFNDLQFKYQSAPWDDDAKSLFAQSKGFGVAAGVGSGNGAGVGSGVKARAGDSQAADDDPCEFKIEVLQALFHSDPARGTAVATEWLRPGSTQTPRCKGAALSLLARYVGKSATPVILGVAKNDPDPKLRAKAISVLGQSNDDSVIDTLRDFALNSTDTDISEASLYALSQHTSERAMVVLGEIATSNRPLPLRKAAIASISGRPGEPAVDTLLKIYDADQNLEIRKSAINGFSRRKSERAGAKLLEIAKGSDNIELRKTAVNAIARRSGEGSIDILLGLYDTEKNEELRDQIINSLGNSNDQRIVRKLIAIARNPQTPMERRKRAIGWLSRSKDPEVLAFLEELLKQ